MNLADLITTSQGRLENLFHTYLTEKQYPAPTLQKAMSYAVMNGGKRIRPLLVYLSGYALNAPMENLDPAACAIELIHAYSLVHDDLPAMDNSDLRRGNPACHKAFNEAIAILAGDALQPLAFEIITQHPAKLSAEQRLQMIQTLCSASGIAGMAAGQMLDLAGVHSLESLTHMYQLKTGALLAACVKLGAIAANNQNPSFDSALETYAQSIGLAFQIQDDLLDIESSTEDLGKPQGIDVINEKVTYPTLIGVEACRQKVKHLFDSALDAIQILGPKSQMLSEFAHLLLKRRK